MSMPFYPFLRGGDGGQRGHLEDEARGVEETASDSSSDRKAADTKGGSGDRGFKREASPKGGEANSSGRDRGVLHQKRGQPSNRRMAEEIKQKVIATRAG